MKTLIMLMPGETVEMRNQIGRFAYGPLLWHADRNLWFVDNFYFTEEQVSHIEDDLTIPCIWLKDK